jgi:predicted DNA-binding transcriptional regulator YafY
VSQFEVAVEPAWRQAERIAERRRPCPRYPLRLVSYCRPDREERIREYLHIGGQYMSARRAAQRLRVSERTVRRYRAWLRENPGALA